MNEQWQSNARTSVIASTGWAPVHRSDVVHTEGHSLIRMESWFVGQEAELEQIASSHRPFAVPSNCAPTQQPSAVLGFTEGERLTYSWTEDATDWECSVGVALADGWAYAATWLIREPDGPRRAAAQDVVRAARIHLITPTVPNAPERRTSPADFTVARADWHRAAPAADSTKWRLTHEESLAVARHYQVPLFPGTDINIMGDLQPEMRERVLDVVWKSLDIRLRDDCDDAAGPEALGEAMRLATSHDLLVVRQVVTGGERATTWFTARPDRMTVTEGGDAITLSTQPTGALVALLAADVPANSAVTVSCVVRQDGRVVGDEYSWTTSADGAHSTAGDPRTPEEVRVGLTELLDNVTAGSSAGIGAPA